jgi:hypothetical protein
LGIKRIDDNVHQSESFTKYLLTYAVNSYVYACFSTAIAT